MRTTMLAVVPLLIGWTIRTSGPQTVRIRHLGPAVAVAPSRFDARAQVFPMRNGSVFVTNRNKVVLLDSTLNVVRTAVDSSSFTPGRRPSLAAVALPYLADSLLVVDFNASGFLVVDPQGTIVRAIAAPKSSDLTYFMPHWSGLRSDSRGRLIYRAAFPRGPSPTGSVRTIAVDTFPIVRADFATRTVDTLAVVKVGNGEIGTITRMEEGRLVTRSTKHPLPTTDSWVALPDGTIAIVRGTDFHVDWVGADGSKNGSPKLPFDWRRITDDDKVRIIDSLAKAEAKMRTLRDSLERTGALVRPPGLPALMTEFVLPHELPDYYPPVRDGITQADPDGNVWILPNTSASARGGLLYDVVNRRGDHFRVQLPAMCSLNGLGRSGVVYLICSGRLERRQIQ